MAIKRFHATHRRFDIRAMDDFISQAGVNINEIVLVELFERHPGGGLEIAAGQPLRIRRVKTGADADASMDITRRDDRPGHPIFFRETRPEDSPSFTPQPDTV